MRRNFTPIERLEQRQLLSIQPVGPELRVNTFTTGHQRIPAIGMDADGDLVITWDSAAQDGSNSGIYAQRFNAAGVPQASEFRVNTFTDDNQQNPTVGMDADGDFVITWTSYLQDGSFFDIYAQRYNAAGVAQGGEFRVNTFTTNLQGVPTIGMDADGDFVIAWHSNTQDGNGYGIYAQRYDATGEAQGSEFRVNTSVAGGQLDPAIGMDADGNFVIAWGGSSPKGFSGGISAQRYNAAGVAQGGEFLVNTYTTNQQLNPAIATDADGDFVIAWQSLFQDGSDLGIYAQRYNSAGVAQGSEFRVNTFVTGAQRNAAIGMDADGDCVIAWASKAQDGSDYGIYAQRYSAAGLAQGGEFRVNTFTTNFQYGAAIGMDADGDCVVAWSSYGGQDGSGIGVYAQRYTVVPTVGTSSFRFATAPHRLQFAFDENVFVSLGAEDLIVENLTTMQTIPASDFSVAYDPLTNTGTFGYTGSAGGIPGVLPDGNYRATLLAAGVTTPNGNSLPTDHVLSFRFLQGDANNDGRVNLEDFNGLAANFGQSPRDFTQGDFDYSGTVNLADFNILAARFGTVLAMPGARSAPPFGTREIEDARDDDVDQLLS